MEPQRCSILLRPDWSAIAPLPGLGPIEPTAAGFRAMTEAGPVEVAAFGPGIFRLTLGRPSGPDFGILVAEAAPPPGVEVEETEAGVAGDARAIFPLSSAAGRCG